MCVFPAQLIAVYEEKELQSRTSVSPGGSVASGYSSPYASEPELGVLHPSVGTEIEVTSRTLKSSRFYSLLHFVCLFTPERGAQVTPASLWELACFSRGV